MKKLKNYLQVAFIFAASTFLSTAKATEIISNFGRTGLLINPSAYTVKDGHMVLGSSYVYPYLRVYGDVGFFPGLELGGTITEIRTLRLDEGEWKGYGYYKDKAFFAKYQVLPEMGKYPAIAVGWDDFHGTKLFETKYIVVTKYVDSGLPQNVTLGYASGVIDGFFFGTETLLHPKLSFIAEYSPIKKDKLKGLNEVKSKYNFGFKFQPYRWLQAVVSFQRGKELGINVNFDIPMGKPWLPHKPRYFILTKRDIKLLKENRQTEFFEEALRRLGFCCPKVYISGDTLFIEYSNESYFYESVALRKVLSIFKVVYFPNVRWVKFILKDKNIVVTELSVPGYLINQYLMGKVDFETFLEKVRYTIAPDYRPRYHLVFSHPELEGALKLRTFLNDPSGAFKYKLSYDVGLKEYFLDNFIFQSTVIFPIKNNISSVNSPLMPKPVRSDIDDYLNNDHPDVPVLSVSYISPLFERTFVGISAGYNELMFAGIGGDVLHFFGDGRLAMGVGGDWVRKRDPNRVFKLRNYGFHDLYVSAYYTMKYPEMHFAVKAGRFLAGDKGIRFEVSRVVKGFEVGFWYTYSDTSEFTGPNKNYHDKGVFVAVPLRMFKWRDTKQVGYYSLSPWTRDVGQLAGRPVDIYRLLESKMPFYLKDKADTKE